MIILVIFFTLKFIRTEYDASPIDLVNSLRLPTTGEDSETITG